jgi:hypothetical protein
MGREDAIQYGALMLAGYIDRFEVKADKMMGCQYPD